MGYLLLFLEGFITFVSPCFLPLLPIYVSYFAAGDAKGSAVFVKSLGFVLGFSIVFVALGAFAGAAGGFLSEHQRTVNIVSGLLVVLIGLNYLGIINISLVRRGSWLRAVKILGFPSAVLFGMVFSVSWTPCAGAFLGAALLRASQQGSALEGMAMLFAFSGGLGVPLIICSVLLDRLKDAFAFIKRHYRVINIVSGGLLIVVGVLMMFGMLGRYFTLFVR